MIARSGLTGGVKHSIKQRAQAMPRGLAIRGRKSGLAFSRGYRFS